MHLHIFTFFGHLPVSLKHHIFHCFTTLEWVHKKPRVCTFNPLFMPHKFIKERYSSVLFTMLALMWISPLSVCVLFIWWFADNFFAHWLLFLHVQHCDAAVLVLPPSHCYCCIPRAEPSNCAQTQKQNREIRKMMSFIMNALVKSFASNNLNQFYMFALTNCQLIIHLSSCYDKMHN